MRRLKAGAFVAMWSVMSLPTLLAAAGLNPPKVTDSTQQSILWRMTPGYEARCFKESSVRVRGEWTSPKKSSSDYFAKVEVRNGVDYLSMSFQEGANSMSFAMELDSVGAIRKVPPILETNIPGFEKEYGPQVTKLLSQVMTGTGEGFLGRTLEVGKDYGAPGNLCAALGVQNSGSPKGTTVVDGTLDYAGRPAFLFSWAHEQTCVENGVSFNVEASGWTVHDRASGLPVSSASQFELFSRGTRFQQSEEFVECGVTEKK